MPEIQNDETMKWIYNGHHRGRVDRGLTSAGKQSRGITTRRGHSPSLKVRPSLRAWDRRGKQTPYNYFYKLIFCCLICGKFWNRLGWRMF